MIPDITGPKVLYPSLLFYALNLLPVSLIEKTTLFIILYYTVLKVFTHVVFTKNDILISALVFYVMSQRGYKLTDATVYYLFTVALLRFIFPRLYY